MTEPVRILTRGDFDLLVKEMRQNAIGTPVTEHGVYSSRDEGEEQVLSKYKDLGEAEEEDISKYTRVAILYRRVISITLTLEENDPVVPGKRCWHLSMVEFLRPTQPGPARMQRFEGGWANHFVQKFLGEATEVENIGALKAVRHFFREYQDGERIDPRGTNERGEVEA